MFIHTKPFLLNYKSNYLKINHISLKNTYNYHNNSYINSYNNTNFYNNTNIDTNFYNPIIGSPLGIPLNILQYIFTTSYYHSNIISLELITLQFAIGIFTYGSDRILDSFDYYNSKNKINYSNDKVKYYNYLFSTLPNNLYIILFSYIYIFILLLPHYETYPILLLLTSTLFYRELKKKFGQFKAAYVGLFWTIGAVILPCILHDHTYQILNNPEIYIPCFLTMFSSSNLLDIKDIDEDKAENVITLPVILGKNKAIAISHISLLMSTIYFNDFYLNNIDLNNIDLYLSFLLFQLQNFASFFI